MKEETGTRKAKRGVVGNKRLGCDDWMLKTYPKDGGGRLTKIAK